MSIIFILCGFHDYIEDSEMENEFQVCRKWVKMCLGDELQVGYGDVEDENNGGWN